MWLQISANISFSVVIISQKAGEEIDVLSTHFDRIQPLSTYILVRQKEWLPFWRGHRGRCLLVNPYETTTLLDEHDLGSPGTTPAGCQWLLQGDPPDAVAANQGKRASAGQMQKIARGFTCSRQEGGACNKGRGFES